MKMTASAEGRELTIRLHGELDHHSAKKLMQQLEQEVEATLPLRLALDFGGVTFMDSSGIAVVMRTNQRMRELGGRLCVIGVKNQPRKVFEAAELSRFVEMQ